MADIQNRRKTLGSNRVNTNSKSDNSVSGAGADIKNLSGVVKK